MSLNQRNPSRIKRAILAPKNYAKRSFMKRHPFAVPVVVFLVMITLSFGLFISYGGQTIEDSNVKRVEVYVDGQSKTLPTRAKTVGELLKRLDINLSKEDIVEPGVNSPITNEDFRINVYRAKPVTIIDEDGNKVSTKVAESSPVAIARKAGIKVYQEDKVEFADPNQALSDGVIGDLIVIDRAVPVTVNLYGNNIPTRTHAETVGELLEEKNIKSLEGDNIFPTKETKITEGMVVFIVPAGKTIDIREESIEPPIETQYDATLDADTVKVVDPGQPGKRVVVYELQMQDGKEVSRKEIQSIISINPTKKVVIRGTKTAGFEGGFSAALASLRSCEGGYTSINYSGGYYGAYQFNTGTWRTNAPAGYKDVRPDQAPPAVQDEAASNLYRSRGWQPWPSCSRKLGLQDVYR